ncbi:MAG: T9SS type A sorting domain-containing protein [Bacteroidota bacterium]|nr:T9SS type A sorting domain-containing protein [Bacteroidota bacterium]
MKQKIGFIIPFLLVSFATTSFSQWVQTSGPGAQVYSIASLGNNVFAGTQGGVFITSDAGNNWRRISNDFGSSVNCLWSSSTTLFAGTEYSGIFTSSDTGLHWISETNGVSPHAEITCIAGNDQRTYAGAFDTGGIFVSMNGSATWSSCSSELANVAITSVAVNGPTLFAGSRSRGIFLSTNSGVNWKAANSGLRFDSVRYKDTTIITYAVILSLAMIGNDVFAGTDSGVFFSNNNGNSWSKKDSGLTTNIIFSLVANEGSLFAGTDKGVFNSTNNGGTWRSVGLKSENVYSLSAIDTILLAGTDKAVWKISIPEISTLEVYDNNNEVKNSFSISPNPFFTKTTISFSNDRAQYATISIMDLLGKVHTHLFSGKLDAGDHSYQWDASHAPPGMYHCIIRTNDGVKQLPLLVVR